MKIISISMSKYCSIPGTDISKPIYVKDFDKNIPFPKELFSFFKDFTNGTTFWVVSSSIKNTKTTIKDIGTPDNVRFKCHTASNCGFAVDFEYQHSEGLSNIQFVFDGIIFKPNLKIEVLELLSFLTMSDKDSWHFIVQNCKLSPKQFNFASHYCKMYDLDILKIGTK